MSAIRDGIATAGRDSVLRSRCLIVVAGLLSLAYALGVLWYVLTVPDIGIVCAFGTEVNDFDESFLAPGERYPLQRGDQIISLDGKAVENWPHFLRLLNELGGDGGKEKVQVEYERPGVGKGTVTCRLGKSPVEKLAPSVLWFLLKVGLFVVGALVFWKRPGDRAARQFFLLGVFSCGAYLGGYHWQRIVTQEALVHVFMVAGILLPSVTLHFFLLFPRPKPFFERRPLYTLLALYVPPAVFLVLLLSGYWSLRVLLDSGRGAAGGVAPLLIWMWMEIQVYLVFALLLYLLCVVSLWHGLRGARDATERNQVKWILFGAAAAAVPMGYSLYLALLHQDRFGGGAATWPMFFASLCVTVAFTVSITRYRLMELDKLLSSGAVYVAISVLAAAVYYGVVFVGVLLLGSRILDAASFTQAVLVSSTVLVLLVALNLARSRIKRALDRHFRREKVKLDQTLQRMSEAVAQLVDPPTLARRLLHTSKELLGAERGAVYLAQGDPPLYRLADAAGENPPLTELSSGCPLVEHLLARGSLLAPPHRPGGNGADHAPAPRQLHFVGGEVALAISHEGRMLALLVLGAKAGGPYTAEDLSLLSAFSQMTALALVSGESGRTIESLHRELQAKVEKIAEQQRRILALQSQLSKRSVVRGPLSVAKEPSEPVPADAPDANGQRTTDEGQRTNGIIGSGPVLRQLLQTVRKVAGSPSAVLLRGESGTGKELLARALHVYSPRAGKPFVKVLCAALSPTLLESELFGHVKGAFTGAVRDRAGRFEMADGGAVFLDEIGDISLEVQTKLLRVLQEMAFERVGSSEPIRVDVRIIAATHQDLEELIRQGRFREDLFYRLNVLPVHVPPLRERREDIPELVDHFLRVYSDRCGKPGIDIDDDALAALKAAPWPGNVRQLENVLERAVVIAEGSVLTLDDLPPELFEFAPDEEGADSVLSAVPLEDVRADWAERDRREREMLVRALAATKGNKAEAARALGMARSTLLSRLKKYGLS